MPSKSISASPAVATLLHDRRRRLGLTLRAVSAMSADGGDPIPHSTLARIESGALDPGVRRLGHLLRLYRLPAQAAGDLLDLEALAADAPAERNPVKLKDRALAAWQDGRVGEALACFLAFRTRVSTLPANRHLRQEAVLSFAVAASSLGKHHLSRQLVDDLLLNQPEPALLVAILVQQSVVWLNLGSTEAALAFLDRAAVHIDRGADRHRGWIDHQRGLVHVQLREFRDAARHLDRAVKSFRKSRSTRDEASVLISRARCAFERGDGAAATSAARYAARFAGLHRFSRLRLFALLELARARRLMGAIAESSGLLRTILADSLVANDNVIRFHAHYNLWKAEAAGGAPARAEVELREAAYFARFVDETGAEASEVRSNI
jgi:tetratricopeptide (TPR) repeat protein